MKRIKTGPKGISRKQIIEAIKKMRKPTLKELARLAGCSAVNIFLRLQRDRELNSLFHEYKIRMELEKKVRKMEENEEEKEEGLINTNEQKEVEEVESVKKSRGISDKEWERTAVKVTGYEDGFQETIDVTARSSVRAEHHPNRIEKLIEKLRRF
jgi:Phenylalanyl-tRNA synthetase alpha subunit